MEFESVTMHLDRTFGLMYREDGELRCTCGWSEFDGTSDPTRGGSTEPSSGSGSHTPPAATSSAAAPDAGSQDGSGLTPSPFGADSRKPQEVTERDARLLAGEPEPLKIIVPVEIEEA